MWDDAGENIIEHLAGDFGSFVEKSLPGGRSGEMRGFLKEHSGVFGPDEVHILVAAFDKAWETVSSQRREVSGG
jgi:hypothetical protein